MMSKRSSLLTKQLVLLIVLVLFLITIVGHHRDAFINARLETSHQAQFLGLIEGDHELFWCDRSQFRTDICNMKGDIRMLTFNGNKPIVLYAKDPATSSVTEIVKPYTRKWEKSCMDTVHEVTLRIVPANSQTDKTPCDVHHKVPGVVFSTSGYTGNLFHEFNDGLIPLFITSQHLKGEVVFIITEFHNWWLTKYFEVLQQLSQYEIISFENDTRVHCFPELEVGLHIHDDLTVDPNRMPNHESIRDFRKLLDRGYENALRFDSPIPDVSKPKLSIIVRNGTRKFLNLGDIVTTAEELGFNVSLLSPDPTMELKRLFQLLNSTDVLMGVHGAAMTHFLFMKPGKVLIQVIPLGIDWASTTYYGKPTKKMGLHYLPYKILPSESSLSRQYNASDPILVNPDEIFNQQGWWTMKKIFLEGQDVRPSLTRMRKIFMRALKKLKRPVTPPQSSRTATKGGLID